ncbi:sigma-70 family RNA polymerase sigma factor [Photorhabdus noenieputensis]|uniref:sigma-70 family RNA polymerase sigma factor n=1 Tax=Photorhabdus noenieputensis TaxID=1208607 RepID=UPI001FD36328|nr:sigma-70 family RNA polymerase sigma factor [Photorhabdus noenieputensis]MCK3667759.1 sigma-70 family RNA polymerase sigma factor [Photorhabdus noenieputensis]
MAVQKAMLEINSSAQQFYFEHHDWLYNWLRCKVPCPCHAEDLTQDTFLNVLSSSNLSDIRQPRPFLATVARCLVANYYRRRKTEENYLEYINSTPEMTMPSAESRIATFEQLEKLEITLDKLPVQVKSAFLLAQLQGLRYSQIADQLQVSSSSVKQYLQRAHNKCKKIQILT